MKPEIGIVAKNLVVKKHHDAILDNLTFEIAKGKITGLIGPSGSGKTTLIRAIVGVQVYYGSIKILGVPAGSAPLREKIGYVTQAPAVYQDLTVLENLRYFATLTRASKTQIDVIVEQVQLMKQRDQLVEDLSGGQKARVSLAAALLGDPDVIILDEPTVGLDPLLREELWQLFRELADAGKTLLVSSHVMDEAEKCDAILLLREGRLLWQDSKEELLSVTKTTSIQDAFLATIRNEEGK